MSITKKDFDSLDTNIRIAGCDPDAATRVTEVVSNGQVRVVRIKFPGVNKPISCVWDEVTNQIVNLNGVWYPVVEKLNSDDNVGILTETTGQLADEWEEDGTLTREQVERLRRAALETSRQDMDRFMFPL